MSKHSLDSVTIDGFRGLRNLTLNRLGPLNILVGENNSGKTSVLEALSILCNPYEPSEWLAMVRRRDFGGLDETRIQSLRWCFEGVGHLDPYTLFESRCEMRTDGRFPLRRLVVNYRDVKGQPNEREMQRIARQRGGSSDVLSLEDPWIGAEIAHHVELKDRAPQRQLIDPEDPRETVSEVLTIWENDVMLPYPFGRRRREHLRTETLTPYSYQLNRVQTRSYSRQLFEGRDLDEHRRELAVNLIREFDPDILDIELASMRGERPSMYIRHRRLGPCPLSIFGDALRRAVLLASTLEAVKGGVLLIDEIETGIHVTALERVFTWLANAARQLDVQVIATTHSLEAVDAVVESLSDRIDDLVTFHINQTQDETRVKRIAGELLLRLRRERGLDVR